MPYIVQADLAPFATNQDLIDLTCIDGEPTESINTDVLDTAIAHAQATVDSFLAKRYDPIPIEGDVPELVKKFTAVLAICELRFGRDAMDPPWPEKCAEIKEYLKMVGDGDVEIPELVNDTGSRQPISIASEGRKLTRARFRGETP